VHVVPDDARSAEHARLAESTDMGAPWRLWGPYLAGRQWGTVREDYSEDGDPWGFFPFDHARARAYRWGEDGLGGISDRYGFLNFSVALWNGRDPILEERLFGLTNEEGNHGEDAKEYWWAVDGTPTHSRSRPDRGVGLTAVGGQPHLQRVLRRRHRRGPRGDAPDRLDGAGRPPAQSTAAG
jgi:hypothetical protein